jgi:hypothetical protein
MRLNLSALSIPFALLALCGLLAAPVPAHADSTELTLAKKCRKTVGKEARTYTKKRMNFMLKCIDKLLKCEILLEVDGEPAGGCRGKAEDSCVRALGPAVDSKLNRARDKFDTKSGLQCLLLGIAEMKSTGPGGLAYANDATCGTEPDVPSLLDCLRVRLEGEVDAIVVEISPRAALLLDNAGLGAEFPNLPRPPYTDVVISATAAGSGVLVSPGTINLPAGNALRVSGDDATLSCGGGKNGKLTITLVADGITQERQLKEPYGVDEVAIFGPFTDTGADPPYTIDLKDSSCSDQVAGTVDVQ